MIFKNRTDAGKKLAILLKKYKNKNVLVLALPRGGVPVAAQLVKYLSGLLDVFVVRKIGAPNDPELAIGAIAPGGVWFLDRLTIQNLGITNDQMDELAKKEVRELIRRQKEYRDDLLPPIIKGKIVILCDDGIATGATMKAAIRAVQKQTPKKIIVAVPVCSLAIFNEIKPMIDELICIEKPITLTAVGAWYKDFSQVTDEEVKTTLRSFDKQRRIRVLSN